MAGDTPSARAAMRVLIVEDEDLIAMELEGLLEDGGYAIDGPVKTVAAALAAIRSRRPDACVLDVNLRGEISAPVAALLRETGVPFLLSSAYEQDTLGKHGAFHGVANIGKPVSPQKLLETLVLLLKSEA